MKPSIRLAALLAGWLLLTGASLDTHRSVQQGNAALAAGDAATAVQVYERALANAPEQPELIYNLGTASLLDGDAARAGQLLADARDRAVQLGEAADPKLAGNAAFNLGNALMAVSEAEGTEPEAKQAALKGAVDAYRDAVAADPTDPDARRNLQLAASALKAQQAQQKQDGDPKDGEQGQDGEQKQDGDPQDGESGDPDQKDDPSQSQDGQTGDSDSKQADAGEQPKDSEASDGEQSDDGQQAKNDGAAQEPESGSEVDSQQMVDAQRMDPRDVERLLGSLSRGEAATMREAIRRAMGPAVAVERDW